MEVDQHSQSVRQVSKLLLTKVPGEQALVTRTQVVARRTIRPWPWRAWPTTLV
jgi:hypothetical protein